MVGHLKKLEILSFRHSKIKELPLEIGQLTQLQVLDLSNCWWLKVIAPNVISKLSRLEELYVRNSFLQWDKVEGGRNASLVELKGLSKLTTLEIDVTDAEILPQKLVFVELQRYRIRIGDEFWRSRSVKTESSRLMSLQMLENVSILFRNNEMIKLLLKRTEDLCLGRLKGVQGVVRDLDDGEGFPRLKHLEVCDWSEILHIVGSVGRVRCKVFPMLESLSLSSLSNLETICDSQLIEDQSFSNLRTIKVFYCGKLKHLFSFAITKNLLLLQKVELVICENLEMIIGPDMEKLTTTLGSQEIIAEDDPLQKVIFPSMEELELKHLRNIEKLWPDHFQGTYYCQNLTKVTVERCHRLKYLFSYSMVNSLVQLQHLKIKDCESMEGVVDTTGLGRDEDNLIVLTVFPKLHSLQLFSLSKLRSFANTEHIHTQMQSQPLFDEKVRLPSLEVLSISFMVNLRKIWHHQLASESFSKLKNLEIFWCHNLMNIFPPLAGIPSTLVNLRVWDCDRIEEIIGHVGEEVKENRIAFNELKVLELDGLEKLTSFCLENYTLEFPSLERVSVIRCLNMKIFSHGDLSTPKLYEVQVTESRRWEGNLNFTIQKYYELMVKFRGIKCLKLSELSDFPRSSKTWHGQALPINFNILEKLVVDDCANMSRAIPANLLQLLFNLEDLEVRNCESLEEVLHLEELNADEELFPKLGRLKLIDLPKLKRFCNFTENIIELPRLLSLTIENCPNMETFLSNSTSVLHMTADNKEPQEITSEENFQPADHIHPLFDEKVAFPKLMILNLSRLPKVSHLWKENAECNKVLSKLGILKISECSKLQKLPSSWHLENLWRLEVSKCHGLINLLTLSTSKSLVNLFIMKIAGCKMIEEIIQSQDGEEAKDCIVFRNLQQLGLDCMPSLTSFCLGHYTLEFPSLKQVLVKQCPKMKIFSQGIVDTPKLNKVKLTEDDDNEGCWEGNLNDTIQKLFNEMNSKDKIEPTHQV